MKNTPNTALLVMDMQIGIVSRLADPKPVLANVTKAIAHARKAGVPVIYVTLKFRPGMPEVSSNNTVFASFKAQGAPMDTEAFAQVHPDLAPQDGDIIIKKLRYSAFPGNDLDMILRAQQITHLVLTGISTSGVVLSTLREAADKDYQLTVLSDGCADHDEEVHRVLNTKVFPRQAQVMSVEEWVG
ncbi:cysteine hydrolase [Mucilaginibacter mali]|uniref:Cysteine hydrolase n=1 Tax=Mucilaginibacter mali TaxID=2740462 RepID=A0A7D4QHE5_9SPHI|nr:isochorismatase family cysteine hydrolase [Mucilaginibacter mali]QKJ31892.1 cysteine hydrolase [Mucilaginibacter mali]